MCIFSNLHYTYSVSFFSPKCFSHWSIYRLISCTMNLKLCDFLVHIIYRPTCRCQAKPSCSVMASNSLFGDTCENTFKYLEIEYVCDRGRWLRRLVTSTCARQSGDACMPRAREISNRRTNANKRCMIISMTAWNEHVFQLINWILFVGIFCSIVRPKSFVSIVHD